MGAAFSLTCIVSRSFFGSDVFLTSTDETHRRTVETATAIKNTFEPIISTSLYPRSQIDIFVQVLSQDGGRLSSSSACSR